MGTWQNGRRAPAAGLLALVVALAGCGGAGDDAALRRGAWDAPRLEHVSLAPERPLPGQSLVARVEAVDPRGEPLRFRFAWSVNGRVVEEGSRPTFSVPAHLTKRDEIGLHVVALAEGAESPPLQVTTRPRNRVPLLHELSIGPDEDVFAGVDLEVRVVASDPDEDPLHVDYQWIVNDHPVPGGGPRFDTHGLRRGDRVRADVRVSDGEAEPVVATTAEIILGNTPPEILPVTALRGEGGVFRHTFQATDPDGDSELRFRLVEAPEGAWIDPVSGTLEWRPRAGQVGTHAFEVAVADGHGAESGLRFELRVEAEDLAGSAPVAATPPAALAREGQEDPR
jgi:large repetitive protein